MDEIPTMVDDPRPIMYISWPSGEFPHYEVGQDGVTSIRPYHEPGGSAPIIFLAVFIGIKLTVRVPAIQLDIIAYETAS